MVGSSGWSCRCPKIQQPWLVIPPGAPRHSFELSQKQPSALLNLQRTVFWHAATATKHQLSHSRSSWQEVRHKNGIASLIYLQTRRRPIEAEAEPFWECQERFQPLKRTSFRLDTTHSCVGIIAIKRTKHGKKYVFKWADHHLIHMLSPNLQVNWSHKSSLMSGSRSTMSAIRLKMYVGKIIHHSSTTRIRQKERWKTEVPQVLD